MTEIEMKGKRDSFWLLRDLASGKTYPISAPSFEIDGETIPVELAGVQLIRTCALANGSHEFELQGPLMSHPFLSVKLVFRMAYDNPIIRFRYSLMSVRECQMTKTHGEDSILYFSFHAMGSAKEVRFSEFNEMVHSYTMTETEVRQEQFEANQWIMGPMMVSTLDNLTSLIAYEHGSQYPDAYLAFALKGNRSVRVRAVKGNYYKGRLIGPRSSYDTIWFEAGICAGDETSMAAYYRQFVLRYLSLNNESRKPYLFYNTWAFQERNKHWYQKSYLDSMNFARMDAEIDRAHAIGIEVFVIDTGWYDKTGDWQVNEARFPDRMHLIKAKLDNYGMKLGLWFDPKAAAASSRMLSHNINNRQSYNGKVYDKHPVWETEESSPMCLVSDYAVDFADELIRLHREIGVTYFKWDAIGQYGCNDPDHHHGNTHCSLEEREQCYAFELPLYLTRIVEKVTSQCPDAIIDLDITEGYRCAGLSFLSAGKFFLLNNGPYFANFDISKNVDIQFSNENLFFHPGPARGWICRSPLTYDKWIPTVLLLTHYLADDPKESQRINIGSLILGQNGIWGDLLNLSAEGVDLMAKCLSLYKQVRDEITKATIRRTGLPGSNGEVYEKIDPSTGKGVMVAFASSFGKPWGTPRPTQCQYISFEKVDRNAWVSEGGEVQFDSAGRAVLSCTFDKPTACIAFFGIDNDS
ncbi:alpha-galactosidase [Paenibacillus aurantius]|uniref:Alpha-galactosidase n=1 Tax=Paenibacillus aurantius TaxID=2918900 RepID=A0AA96RI14_9BACL|nr:alpha-galactosidase [Paenibacillus aurantius]WNQ13963.1 alpha-galactosidase [Paenibacillus aurantius]